MARQAGRIQKLAVSTDGGTNYTEVKGIADATLNLEQAELTTTAHDDGDFETFIVGRKNGSIDVTVRYDEADAGQQTLLDSFFDGTTLDYRWRMRGDVSGARELTAKGIITSQPQAAPNDDVASMDTTIRLTGTITKATQA